MVVGFEPESFTVSNLLDEISILKAIGQFEFHHVTLSFTYSLFSCVIQLYEGIFSR
jgi:hypothetical protein